MFKVSTRVNKIEATYEASREKGKVERVSILTYTWDISYSASNYLMHVITHAKRT